MPETAAFFRVEGPLTTRPTAAAAAYLAANAPHLRERMLRVGGVALSAPLKLASGLGDPVLATRLLWSSVRGLTEDRIAVLGEEYATRHLIPSITTVGRDLVASARAQGHRVVLVSEHIEPVACHVARALGIADLIANRLEVRDGVSTGRLIDPVIAAHTAVQWVKDFSGREHIDLRRSLAYGTRREDGLLLSQAGHPCAVGPDRGLRRLARDLDWPIVEA